MISKTQLVFEVEIPFNDEVMIHLQFVTSFKITYWMARFLPISSGAQTVSKRITKDTI